MNEEIGGGEQRRANDRERESLMRGVRARVDLARWEWRQAEREAERWGAKVRAAKAELDLREAELRELESAG